MSEYTEQAQAFLDRFGLRFRATFKGDKCPECRTIHGDRYRVTISRRGDYVGNQNLTPKRIAFDFWGSFADQQAGVAPTAYDVLACISGDIYCPDDFEEEFCSEYGYERDRRAEATFRRCSVFAKRLRKFFTTSEQEELGTIS